MDLKEHHFEGAAGFYGYVDLLAWFGPSSSRAPRGISVRCACDWWPPGARMSTSLRAGSFGEPALRFFNDASYLRYAQPWTSLLFARQLLQLESVNYIFSSAPW